MRKFTLRLLPALLLFTCVLFCLTCSARAEDDRTFFQWGFNEEFFEEDEIPYDMRIPGWNSEDGNMEEEILVVVIDGGIDYNHPDLQGKVYEFSEEERAVLRCGRYGYDAVKDDDSDPPPDIHATHVAGIIGAAWDGGGVSGAASNVRFISINVGEGDHTPVEYTLRAYDFILRALDYGLPIRLVNNSWGNVDTSLAMLPLIEEAGRRGVLSFFAAGNDSSDLEHSIFYPVMYLHDAPSLVVIGAHDWTGDEASFSNYGQSATDVFAPGTEIMSSVTGYAGGNYSYRSGTSMACPAACGACAVLAAAHPEIKDAGELKTLFLSCVRPTGELADIGANGIVDLSVDARGDRAPVIERVRLEGTLLVIEGAFFGGEGTVTVTDAADAAVECGIVEGSLRYGPERITLSLQSVPNGLLRVQVRERTYGKLDSACVLAEASEAVFEKTLSLPEAYGARDAFDAMFDYQAAGYLGGHGEYLYYLPLRFVEENGDTAFEHFFRYDIAGDSWKELAPLPERVVATQGAFLDEYFYVAGSDARGKEARFYRYDLAADVWERLEVKGQPRGSAVVNCDGELYLIGGVTGGGAVTHNNVSNEYYFYDPVENVLYRGGKLAEQAYNAVACFADGTLYVYGASPAERDTAAYALQVLDDFGSGQTQLLPDAFPELFEGEGLLRDDFSPALHGGFAACKDGLIVTGVLSADTKIDTWLLGREATSFTPLAKSASDADVYWPACAVYEDIFYVIGSSCYEEGHRVFRATEVSTLAAAEN
ncbi:MAG: S8 family serine peptidase [Lachnospiraceae bacterium]|nr:S8 family serine peptidase [Lachnospiraceae bacterium]